MFDDSRAHRASAAEAPAVVVRRVCGARWSRSGSRWPAWFRRTPTTESSAGSRTRSRASPGSPCSGATSACKPDRVHAGPARLRSPRTVSPTIPLPPHDAPLAGGSPFPPIADYAFLSDCHTVRAGRARREHRVDVPAAVRLAERVRRAARPAGRLVPGRAVRDRGAAVGPLRPGHDDRRDDLDDAVGVAGRVRRDDDRPLAPRALGRDLAHAAADRPGRRPHAGADDRVHPGPRAGRGRVRADVRLRAQRRRAGR